MGRKMTYSAEILLEVFGTGLEERLMLVAGNVDTHELALLTDMLDASNTRLAAEMSLVDAYISLLYNYYKLKYTVGGL